MALLRLLGLDLVDVDCYAGSNHLPSDHIEADPTAAAERLHRASEATGLAVDHLFFTFGAGGFADRPANAPDPTTRLDNDRRMKAMVECARRVGARGLTTLPGVIWPDLGPDRSLDLAVQGLRALTAIASEAGYILCIEPHLDSVSATPERTRALLDQVPGLRLTLDYSHFLAQQMTPDDVHPLLPFAGHFHARQASPGHLQTGHRDGSLDFPDIYQRLVQYGYTGSICLEYTVGGGWGGALTVDVLSETIVLRDQFRSLIA